MNQADFQKHVNLMMDKMLELLSCKGDDYAMGEDRLSNFKEIARMCGVTPIQVWAVYCGKHFSALMNYASKGRLESEPVEMRFVDLANYAVLGAAIARECGDFDSPEPVPSGQQMSTEEFKSRVDAAREHNNRLMKKAA